MRRDTSIRWIASGRHPVRLLASAAIVAVLTAIVTAREQTREPGAQVAEPANAAETHGAVIRRDTYGVPHILAPTEGAAAFAHGYAVAEDHLEDLAVLFLRARGELASVFGESRLAEDRQVIELGIPQQAREHFARIAPPMQRILDRYAEGYNRYLAEAGSRAPAWAAPVTGADVLAHCRAVYLMNFSPTPASFSHAISGPPTGSNFWGIGPQKSRTGKALLLANPHLPWRPPYLFHEVHLTVPRVLNIAGGALLGFPVVTVGFNDHLGWTHTATSKSGAEQIYRLTLDPADPQRYLLDGRSVPLKLTSTTVRVKTERGEEKRNIETWWSHHGPIIHKQGAHAFAFNSPNLEPLDFLTQYSRMAKARSLAEFRAALALQQLPIMSVGYADAAGNILYVQNGRYPRRPDTLEGELWMRGDRSENDLAGLIPHALLPQLLNPRAGYVQNANNGFAFTHVGQRVDMNAFPSVLRKESPLALRAQYSLETLESRERLSLDEMVRALFDARVPLAARVKGELIALVRQSPSVTPDMENAVRLLESWDDRIAPESTGATLFAGWWTEYLRARPPRPFAREWQPGEPLRTPAGIGDPALAVQAFSRVTGELVKAFGSVAVPWKSVFRVRRGSLELPAPGASETLGILNSLEFTRDEGLRRSAGAGTAYVLAVEFSRTPVAMSVVPYSQSVDPASPHYADQTALFARGTLKRLWTQESEVLQHTVRRYAPGRERRATSAVAAIDARALFLSWHGAALPELSPERGPADSERRCRPAAVAAETLEELAHAGVGVRSRFRRVPAGQCHHE